ncbi:MAG: prolyl oligopeptidase family serine peptidase [Planctomycetota bacterium]|nr:prolyl oligopeptidase family serine peptidase [Planctomycetota bacterium]
MMTHTKLCAVMVCLCFGQSIEAQTRDHDITLEDYFTLGNIGAFAVSPNGAMVAWTEGRWQEDLNRRNQDLWVLSKATKTYERLTFDPAGEGNPQWGPEGRWIYFTTSRTREGEDTPPYDGSTQVWRLRPEGGELFPVTRVKGGVDHYQISQDGYALYYVTGKKHVEPDAWKALRTTFNDLEYGHGVVEFGRVHKLDLRNWRDELLVDENRVIGEMAVSPSGRYIAMITTPTEELITNEGWSHVDVYDTTNRKVIRLEDRRWREDAPSPYGWIVNLTWSDDETKLAFRVDFDGYPGEAFVAHFDDGEPTISVLQRPDEVTISGQMTWFPGTHDLCFLADDHARKRLYRVRQIGREGHGSAVTMTPGDEVISGFGFSRSGNDTIVLRSSLTHMPDLFELKDGGADASYRRLTNINPQVDSWKLPQIQIVTWVSDDGTPVEGLLELPPDYEPSDGPLPLVVSIHGGPTACSHFEFRYWIYGRTLFPAKGWAVFDPNYRGSTGYGDAFLIDLIQNKNNLDVQDIRSGIDALIDRGIADPEQLAVTGWSNGGYLTNCLIVADQRFKAASSGAGVFDTVMQWEIEDTPGHVVNYSGGLPWDQSTKMQDSSPLYNVDQVVTPTLIHVGENDARVPAQHSRALHRSLHHYLNVPCELVVYPGEGHGLSKLSHRKAKMMWDHAWFEHYVLKQSASEDD